MLIFQRKKGDWFTQATKTFTINNINAYGTSQEDRFGYSVNSGVDVHGNYAIIGAYLEDDAGGANSGKAYIVDITTGSTVHTLDNPNAFGTSAGDFFGIEVAIHGNYAVVGARREDDAGGTNSGKVYIFDVTTGNLLTTIDNPNTYGSSTNDIFGSAVATDGNYIIVGSRTEEDAGGTLSGKAHLFNMSGTKLHTFDNPNATGTTAGDYFGYSVAVSGNLVLIGAPFEDDANGNDNGKVYLFNATTGALLHTYDNPNAYVGVSDAEERFGHNIAINDKYTVIAAIKEDDANGVDNGKVYVFDTSTYQLLHTIDNPNSYPGAGDWFGVSVSISGDFAIIGDRSDDASGTDSGKAHLCNLVTGQVVHTIDNPNPFGTSTDDLFAQTVAINGSDVVIGAPFEDDAGGNDSGKVYIYKLS